WNPLRSNMPATAIRDLVVHDQDLVVGTHGRGFWILDDITPLRQISAQVASSAGYLFEPGVAYRVKRDTNTDTPLPPEEPGGQNPPDGAIIDYYLKAAPTGPVVLEILDQSGKTVRRYSSDDKPEQIDPKRLPVPTYWIKPQVILSAAAGMHRFVWDLHYPRPDWIPPSFPISAIYHNTPPEPSGPVVMPGEYTVKLTVGRESFTRSLTVKMDPRVKTPEEGLRQQFDLSMKCYEGMRATHHAELEVREIRRRLRTAGEKASGDLKSEIALVAKKAAEIGGAGTAEDATDVMYFAPGRGRRGETSITDVQTLMTYMTVLIQGADATPTSQAVAGVNEARQSLEAVMGRWKELMDTDVKSLNEKLKAAGLPEIEVK
ncbi:MAG: glycoside hydrolase, partial [Blastocatellia bacterium]